MDNKKIKTSIIIPVFEIKIELLERCIQSIYKQKVDNYEIILVLNGCSQLYKDKIKDNFQDEKVRIICTSEKGVSNARNIGIQNALGEYIAFVDGDDTITSDFLKTAIALAEQNQLDYLSGGISYIFKDYEIPMQINSDSLKIYNNITLLKQLLVLGINKEFSELNGFLLSSPCSKLYKKSVIEDIKFNIDVYRYEDLLFNFEVLLKCSKPGIVPYCWYNYYQYKNSAIHTFDKRIIKNNYNLIGNIYNLLYKRNHKVNLEAEFILFNIFMIKEIPEKLASFKDWKKFIKFYYNTEINSLYDKVKTNNYYNLNRKIRFYLLKKKSVMIFYVLIRITDKIKSLKNKKRQCNNLIERESL